MLPYSPHHPHSDLLSPSHVSCGYHLLTYFFLNPKLLPSVMGITAKIIFQNNDIIIVLPWLKNFLTSFPKKPNLNSYFHSKNVMVWSQPIYPILLPTAPQNNILFWQGTVPGAFHTPNLTSWLINPTPLERNC